MLALSNYLIMFVTPNLSNNSLKKLLIAFLALLCYVTSATAAEWHISPTGSPTGLGTIVSPLDLQTALTNAAAMIQPGKGVWLHGGM